MSAGVSEQRMKGQGNQVTNGPKEQIGEGGVSTAGGASEDFESWRPQQQAQGSTAHTQYATSVPISSATDPYSMSTAAGYYGSGGTFPYQSFGMGDGTWSNGTDAIPFLGGYTHDSYSMDGMFGPSTTFSTAFGQPSAFNYFPGNGDYSTWGTQLGQRKHYDDYYRQDAGSVYAAAQPQHDSLKAVEQGVQSLSIDMALGHGKDSKSTVKLTSEVKEPKKLTWASIASQPAKPQVSVQTSGLKKKGPGMPPGPIIPGKHNIDIGTWDTAKPAPPPPQPPQPPAQLPATSPSAGQQVQTNVQTQGPNQVQVQQHQAQIQSQVQVQSHQVHQQQQQQNQQGYQPHQNTQSQVQMQNQVAKNASGPGSSSASMRPPWSGSSRGQAQLQQRGVPPTGPTMPAPLPQSQQAYMQPPTHVPPHLTQPPPQMMVQPPTAQQSHPVLEELRVKNNYNPGEFDLSASGARFFVIKSYSEDDIHRSIKYEIWCSTEHGNKRLDQAFRERESAPGGRVYLFFSVNGSGHFCGMAQMVSPVDYHSTSSVWSQDKWKGQFRVRWIYVKDVPNVQLRHIRLENNENKPVTNSRDTQEVPHAKGQQVLRIMHAYRHSTSIFDDFIHYEKRQEEEDNRKIPEKPVHHQQHHHHHHKEQRGGENNSRRGGGRGGRNMN